MRKRIYSKRFIFTLPGFVALVLSLVAFMNSATTALADYRPSLSVSDPIVNVSSSYTSDNCITDELVGKGFYDPVYLAAYENGEKLAITPSIATPDTTPDELYSTFSTAVTICGQEGPGHVVIVGYYKYPDTSVSVSIQLTHLQAVSNTVTADYGCATVQLTGQGFTSSAGTANYVILAPSIGYLPAGMNYTTQFGPARFIGFVNGYRVNTSGYGTIATSFPVCGIKAGETFTINAYDETAIDAIVSQIDQVDFTPSMATFHVVAFS